MRYVVGVAMVAGGGLYLYSVLSALPPGSGWAGLVVLGIIALALTEQAR